MNVPIYLDGFASLPLAPEVGAVMTDAFARPGNSSSPHLAGEEAARTVALARADVASLIGAAPNEIVFTSGATEADNLALLGVLAVGDAIGTTLEFSSRDSGPRLTDMVGGGPFGLKAGQWTDDTAMALALGHSLVADRHLDEHDLMTRFVAWWQKGEYSCTGACFDIGITTRDALARFVATGDPVAGSTSPRSAGNGSLMRLAPVVLNGFATGELGGVSVARRQSATTHGAPACLDACEHFAFILYLAITGKDRWSVFQPRDYDVEPAIARALAGSWRGARRKQIQSSGYVAHSLEAALWCVGRTACFRDAVLLAANLGDDADTTGAITGQLAGALYGKSGIPAEWLERLAWADKIEDLATSLLERGSGQRSGCSASTPPAGSRPSLRRRGTRRGLREAAARGSNPA